MQTRLRVSLFFLLLSFSPFSLFLSRYRVSRAAVVKQNGGEKKDEGETLFVFRGKMRINLSGVRGGAADYGNPEKRERALANGRETKGRTPSKAPTLGARLRHSSSALFARGVAYDGGCHRTSEVAFRSLARSRVTFSSLALYPVPLQAPFFSPAIVWSTLFTDTPRVLGQCPM